MLTLHLNIHIIFFLLSRTNKNSIFFSNLRTLQGAWERLSGVLFDEIAKQNKLITFFGNVVDVIGVELISILQIF